MRKQGQRGLERVTTYYDLPQPPQPPQLIPPYPAPYAPVTHPSSLNPPTLLPPLPPLLACTQTYFPTLLHVLLPTTRISFQSYMTRVQLPPVIQNQGSAASSHTGPGFSCIQSYRTRVTHISRTRVQLPGTGPTPINLACPALSYSMCSTTVYPTRPTHQPMCVPNSCTRSATAYLHNLGPVPPVQQPTCTTWVLYHQYCQYSLSALPESCTAYLHYLPVQRCTAIQVLATVLLS